MIKLGINTKFFYYICMFNEYNVSSDSYTHTLDGLSNEQVQERVLKKLTNHTSHAVGKSYWEIVRTNVLSFFNILLFVIAFLMIIAEHYDGLLFLLVLIPNILIGLYEDLKARYLLSKLRLLTAPRCVVRREGQDVSVKPSQIVLDDTMVLKTDNQICADGILLSGSLLVNESHLTGESVNISKEKGDFVYSGSFVVSGHALVAATKVGRDTYIEGLHSKANKFKRAPSEILKSLRRLFFVIGCITIVLAVVTVILYAAQNKFSSFAAFKESVVPIAGSMVAMIPSGLYLLTSMALATSVISLAKKKAQVQDFYSVEMLARTNVLCVDKTGTITDGTMNVEKVEPLSGLAKDVIDQIVSNILHATGDTNLTALSLKKYFTYELTAGVAAALPFNSDNKYSGATFKAGKTYLLGAVEFLNIPNKSAIMKLMQKHTSLGYRVLLVGESNTPIVNGKFNGIVNPIAFIVLQDHIKESAKKTFEWFKNNNVEVKVISGDNALTVSEIARQAGVEGAERYVSLENMPLEQVELIATEFNVFGRVSPEQKEVIIKTLKKHDKTVAMTGDGVNDILALKRADCSIAMASGSDAARNVSHIVLLDDDFNHLPSVVAEGRRVINNVQRTTSLFLTKTVFAMFFTTFFLVLGIISNQSELEYPFSTNNFYVWEIVAIGFASFFLALEPNSDCIKGKFFKNVFKKLIPAAIATIVPVLFFYICFLLQKFHVVHTYIDPDTIYNQATSSIELLYSSEKAQTMSVIAFTVVSLFTLFKVCQPFKTSKYRLIVFLVSVVLVVSVLVGCGIYTGTTKNSNILEINFLSLSLYNYVQLIAVVAITVGVYLVATYLVEVFKGEHDEYED